MRQIRSITPLSIAALLLLFGGAPAFGQEAVAVGWDSSELSGEFTMGEAVAMLILAGACSGLCKCIGWLARTKGSAVNWRKARLWWPMAMLVWGCLLLMSDSIEGGGVVWGSAAAVFALLNLPSLILAGGVLEIAGLSAAWLRAAAETLALCAGNYATVRLAEWWVGNVAPVSLSLRGNTTAAG